MLRKIALLSSPSSLLVATLGASPPQEQPNFVFIMTDDQDLHLNSLDYMPKLKHLIADEGTVFEKHFCTIAVCCPSRVSLMTGKLAHNTNVTDVNPPYGGYPKFIQEGHNEDYLPVWLQESGYNTYYTGKFLNAHTTSNYDNPFPKGWNGTDYCYWNSTFQRNHDVPVASNGYSTDLITQNSLRFIKEAHASDRPFFIGIAPIAPHAKSVQAKADAIPYFLSPVPAERHKEMFPNAKVPRGANFNPGTPSGASWVHDLSRLNATDLDYMDSFYRARLQSLQAVDELVENVILQLEESRLLENTYIFYTSDNGYHIGQHRLVPGKGCPYEEDINIPMMIRGPGVPKESFDGLPIPLLEARIEHTREVRKREHVSVEYWGQNLQEGEIGTDWTTETPVIYGNNTYKAMRVIGDSYNLFYSVWCTNEHELYDHKNDPYQMDNLFSRSNVTILGRELDKVVSRLDTLLLVLKSCKGAECTLPWETIHPDKTVTTLSEALDSKYDEFYAAQPDISFSSCELGYLPQI